MTTGLPQGNTAARMKATDWTTISCTYDPAGRRIAKSYDGTVVARYLYDGPHIIAEYDGNNRFPPRC